MNFILIALGGFCGSILRYWLSITFKKRLIGTWLANITGSILLAFFFHLQEIGSITEYYWAFLGIGFCGAYTTFSTFGNETLQLLLLKRYKIAIGYVLSSIVVSIITVMITFTLFAS